MSPSNLLTSTVILSSVFISPSCKKKTDKTTQTPNIVFIIADDLGWSQLSCYGSNYYKTPNIDGIASDGVRFTHAYSAAAVSSPTRAAIMTGKYPARLHLTDFIKGDSIPGKPLSNPKWQKYLPLEEITIAEKLKEKGYRTALFGKWHLSIDKLSPASIPYNPDKQGFDETLITEKPSPDANPENDAHNTALITDYALDFIEKNKDTSFFLVVAHNTIHDPIMEKKELIERFKHDSLSLKKENNPVIAAMIHTLDNQVGRIINKIKESGIEKNTLVIFYSDNGGKSMYALQTPFRAGKGWLYEGGVRVPLIVKWPGVVEPGITNHEMVSSIDFFPTILNIFKEQAQGIDGISFLPLLRNNNDTLNRNKLYWNYPHYHRGSGMRPAGAMVMNNYKLIVWYEELLLNKDGAIELYDLKVDPSESQNLIHEYKNMSVLMFNDFQQWMKDVGGQMPELTKD